MGILSSYRYKVNFPIIVVLFSFTGSVYSPLGFINSLTESTIIITQILLPPGVASETEITLAQQNDVKDKNVQMYVFYISFIIREENLKK